VNYLVDANILSEPTRPAAAPQVVTWLRQNEHLVFVDPVILGEIRFGIYLLPEGSKKRRLEHWFVEVVQKIECLTWQAVTGLRWARLLADLRGAGKAMPIKDSLIAATALTHDLTVVTHNTADFRKAGVELLDPFTL
jgi:toxin FitB